MITRVYCIGADMIADNTRNVKYLFEIVHCICSLMRKIIINRSIQNPSTDRVKKFYHSHASRDEHRNCNLFKDL